ncbi:uncharacterized protein PHACADRAFT_257234 [Phanerochaete carnosa HHB-10118-sp]|uniref:Uncharacterized protein n=1 Tax=Phanerochaete carnosa (strain HHB-10118-sp) TaxID=650164 RepID=K5V0Z6_PHACS|nr:uncharacterized protein PHACADRAFT_257234 [Phanerochaete carnosa HHB-10118-sp]EKM56156.1 hypothetical protein PHACADRAFT_257234 [Phanerochaete carnosa HHB-10118-sp]
MALSAPAHRLHGVLNGGVFGSPGWSSIAGASHAEASSFSAVPNTNRGRATLAILAARTAQLQAHHHQPHALAPPPTPVVTRPRRSSVRSVTVPVSIRPRAAVAPAVDDPFADHHAVAAQDFIADALPPPRAASRAAFVHYSTPAAYTYPAAAAPPPSHSHSHSSLPVQQVRRASPQNDNRTAKLVASVLLSRASGRPMRRRPQSPEERTYVKSCLSRAVAVTATVEA